MKNIKLPIGYSDFGEIRREGFYYVDKTKLCEAFFHDKKKATLIARPRRFGKTLNLSMLEHFFAKKVQERETEKLFIGTEISKNATFCKAHQGKYPVISLSLKGISTRNFNLALADLSQSMASLYRNFREIQSSEQFYDDELEIYENIVKHNIDQSSLQYSLERLCEFVSRLYGVKPILLIDEYDVPIQGAYLNDFYEDMVSFMKVFLGNAIKDAKYISRALITGVTRASKESIFSGINNIVVYSLHDSNYGEYFGFIEDDVIKLIEESQATINIDELKKWYNGYLSGNTILYNPWSILSTIENDGDFDYYWVNTSGNELLKKMLTNGVADFYNSLQQLLKDEPINQLVDPHVVFNDLESNTSAIWSLLFNTGYLKIIKSEKYYTRLNCKLEIPNLEVKGLFFDIINDWMNGKKGLQWYQNFLNALINGNIEIFSDNIQDILLNITSYHDTSAPNPEKFYHGLLLGLTAGLINTYTIQSNRESGHGRFDILLIPKDNKHPGYILELKKSLGAKLVDDAKKALTQIEKNQYKKAFSDCNLAHYFAVGIAFSERQINVAHKKHTL